MDGLKKWLKVGREIDILKAMRDRDAWNIMTAYANEKGTCLIK